MAYHFAPAIFSRPAGAERKPGVFRRLLRRLLDAVIESRQRQAEREIARYLAAAGGKFTDGMEREIERRFLAQPPATF